MVCFARSLRCITRYVLELSSTAIYHCATQRVLLHKDEMLLFPGAAIKLIWIGNKDHISILP